ncbi:phage tail fiber protein [Amycolatopsis sp. NPDC004368]
MASGLKTAEAARLLNASIRGTAYVEPTGSSKLELVTTTPSASANGTPVSGGSYADQTFTTSGDTSSASISNSAVIAFTGMPAATIVGANLKDSNASPRYSWYGTFGTAITTLAGDTISFAVGAASFALNNTP